MDGSNGFGTWVAAIGRCHFCELNFTMLQIYGAIVARGVFFFFFFFVSGIIISLDHVLIEHIAGCSLQVCES